MNLIIYYFIIIIAYLGLAQTKINDQSTSISISKQSDFINYIGTAPASVILLSIVEHGVFMKSYFFYCKIVSAYNSSRKVFVRAPKNVAMELQKYIGLSILSVDSNMNKGEFMGVSLPGLIFVGNPKLGIWVDEGNEIKWQFYRPFKFLQKELGWNNFIPTTKDLISGINVNHENFKNDLFGPTGNLSRKFLFSERLKKTGISKKKKRNTFSNIFNLNL